MFHLQNQTTTDEEAAELLSCACNTRTYFCHKQCQIDGWKKHKVACKKARKRKKLDYSKDKFLVGELLSVAMR